MNWGILSRTHNVTLSETLPLLTSAADSKMYGILVEADLNGGSHMRYQGQRIYAQRHNRSRHLAEYDAYKARAAELNAETAKTLAGIEVGEHVYYDHEDSFRLELTVNYVSPSRISALTGGPDDELRGQWNFGGIDSPEPGALHGSTMTWPARLMRVTRKESAASAIPGSH